MTLSARRDGTTIEAAGSLPVAFADFGIKGPSGYGALGSLADHGTAEFLLILAPADGGFFRVHHSRPGDVIILRESGIGQDEMGVERDGLFVTLAALRE